MLDSIDRTCQHQRKVQAYGHGHCHDAWRDDTLQTTGHRKMLCGFFRLEEGFLHLGRFFCGEQFQFLVQNNRDVRETDMKEAAAE